MIKQKTALGFEFKQCSLKEAQKLAKNGDVVILDVRTQEEYLEGHIEGSMLIPYDEIPKKASDMLADKNVPILIYCRAGRRSVIAAHMLANLGYLSLYEFGGYTIWDQTNDWTRQVIDLKKS